MEVEGDPATKPGQGIVVTLGATDGSVTSGKRAQVVVRPERR